MMLGCKPFVHNGLHNKSFKKFFQPRPQNKSPKENQWFSMFGYKLHILNCLEAKRFPFKSSINEDYSPHEIVIQQQHLKMKEPQHCHPRIPTLLKY